MGRFLNTDLSTASDRELVERWCQGEREAPNVLIARYWVSIRAYLSRRARAAYSEDLVQETFMRVTRSVHAFEHRSSFHTYLFSIAEHTLQDHLRVVHRRPTAVELDDRMCSRALTAEEQLIEGERLGFVLSCMDALSPAARSLVCRFYVEGQSARSIAMQDQVPPGTVRRRLFDAREVMRRCYWDDCSTG